MSATPGSGRLALALAPLALLLGLACAAPASAEFFTPTEGLSDSGAPKLTFEVTPYLFLPRVDATIGLNRPAQEDINVSRGRPTIAQVLSKLSFALDCDCLVRYGNFSFETDFIYVSVKNQTHVPPLPPLLPEATLNVKSSFYLVSPGIGYRVFSSVPNKISLDARAGFIYEGASADSEFQLGEFASSGSHNVSFVQPWVGERFDYYPSRRWRLENTLSLTGLGVDGGTLGYQGKLSASYAVSTWFDVQFGYAVTETKRTFMILPDGTNHNFRALLYGPVAGFGFRF
jgi:hypothetical protein